MNVTDVITHSLREDTLAVRANELGRMITERIRERNAQDYKLVSCTPLTASDQYTYDSENAEGSAYGYGYGYGFTIGVVLVFEEIQ